MSNLKSTKYIFIILALILFLLLCVVFSLSIGSIKIPTKETFNILLGKESAFKDIILLIRAPRTFGAIFCGAAIAVAGLLLQVFFSNPIVDSHVLGVSSGATLFTALVMLGGYTFGMNVQSPFFMFVGSFIGALLIMLIILGASQKVKNNVSLLIIGLMIGYLCSAGTGILTTFATRESVKGFSMWTLGSFAGITWNELKILMLITTPIMILTIFLGKPLNSLLMGEDYAKSMGLRVKAFRACLVIVSSLLTAGVTAFAGPIAFIGMSVPHMARLMCRTSDNRWLIPVTIITGGAFTCLCDLLARTIVSPAELAIGTVTAFVGVPIVVYMLLKGKSKL